MKAIYKEVEANKKDTITIIPIGDMHVGSKCFDKDYFEDMLKWIIKEDDCYVIGMGDFCDAVVHMDTRRFDIETIDPEFNTPEKQHRYVEGWFKKLHDVGKLLFILEGNHEAEVRKRYNVEHCSRWSYDIGVPYLGVHGMMRFVIKQKGKSKNQATYDIYAHHGWAAGRRTGSVVNKIQDLAETYDADLYCMGHCLSSDTEVLTNNGWKSRDEIDVEDMVMSFNKDRERLELNKINKIVLDYDSKNYVNFKTNRLDLKVTEDHEVLYKTMSSKGTLMKKKAKDLLGSTFKILQASKFDYPGADISDDMLELYGWIISEGGFAGRKYGMTLSQNIDNAYKIRDLLNRLEIKYSEYIKDSVGRKSVFPDGKEYATKELNVIFYIHSESAKDIREHFNSQKLIPNDLLDTMSREQFLLMLNTMVEGDGNRRNYKSFYYYTSDEILVNQLQAACVTRNIRCNVVRERRGCFDIAMHLDNIDCSVAPYDHRNNITTEEIPKGEVPWCVNVDNSNIVVRRNGYPCITGNSHHKFGDINCKIRMTNRKSDGSIGLVQKKVGFVNTGTFMRTFAPDGTITYAERAGYAPKQIGVVKILLDLANDIHLRP